MVGRTRVSASPPTSSRPPARAARPFSNRRPIPSQAPYRLRHRPRIPDRARRSPRASDSDAGRATDMTKSLLGSSRSCRPVVRRRTAALAIASAKRSPSRSARSRLIRRPPPPGMASSISNEDSSPDCARDHLVGQLSRNVGYPAIDGGIGELPTGHAPQSRDLRQPQARGAHSSRSALRAGDNDDVPAQNIVRR